MIRLKTRKKGTNGQPRLKGIRQLTLAHRLVDPQTVWETVTVSWYGGQKHTVEVATGTALWYHSGLPPVELRWVLIGDPQGKFVPQALLCTDQAVTASQILEWFILRGLGGGDLSCACAPIWAVRRERQWSDLAILRNTPALLGLFSLGTIFADQLLQEQLLPVRQTAWYTKALPTFADTLAFVRKQLWPITLSCMSPAQPDTVEIPRALLERLTETLALAE